MVVASPGIALQFHWCDCIEHREHQLKTLFWLTGHFKLMTGVENTFKNNPVPSSAIFSAGLPKIWASNQPPRLQLKRALFKQYQIVGALSHSLLHSLVGQQCALQQSSANVHS
jgi:hypothetical protein